MPLSNQDNLASNFNVISSLSGNKVIFQDIDFKQNSYKLITLQVTSCLIVCNVPFYFSLIITNY